jgi:hypothetical protein
MGMDWRNSHMIEPRGARVFYISCIDREISDCKSRISYSRTTLLTVLVALSSLFWSIANTIGDEQLRSSIAADLAPFVVSVMACAIAASGFWSIYQSKYTPRTPQSDSGPLIEVLPHTLTLILILGVAAVASLLTISHIVQSDYSLDQSIPYFLVFGITFFLFLTTAYNIVKGMLRPRGGRLSREVVSEKVSKRSVSIRSILWASSFIYLILGILTLNLAWHMNEKTLYLLLAVQGSGILILIFFAFERVGDLVHESFCLSSLREERSIAIHEGLRDTEYGDRYQNLETVDLELHNSDEQ